MAGADATVYIWFLDQIYVNNSRGDLHIPLHPLGFYEECQIIFGTVNTTELCYTYVLYDVLSW